MKTGTGVATAEAATEDEIQQQVEEVVRTMAPVPGASINPETRLIADLGYHSLRLFELSMVLELRFKVELPIEETMEVDTIDDVRALVAKLIRDRRPGP
jgi:acyl carrier protein